MMNPELLHALPVIGIAAPIIGATLVRFRSHIKITSIHTDKPGIEEQTARQLQGSSGDQYVDVPTDSTVTIKYTNGETPGIAIITDTLRKEGAGQTGATININFREPLNVSDRVVQIRHTGDGLSAVYRGKTNRRVGNPAEEFRKPNQSNRGYDRFRTSKNAR
jgi:hypothetical protein